MKMKKHIDFDNLCADILNNERFIAMKGELHHGITRYEHSLRVGHITFKIAKFFHMKNIKKITRASLLHDFYLNKDFKNHENEVEKLSIHPTLAYENAIKFYKLGKLEENIIKSHMYPMGYEKPKYKESILVTLVDKVVSFYEQCRYKPMMKLNIYLLFYRFKTKKLI